MTRTLLTFATAREPGSDEIRSLLALLGEGSVRVSGFEDPYAAAARVAAGEAVTGTLVVDDRPVGPVEITRAATSLVLDLGAARLTTYGTLRELGRIAGDGGRVLSAATATLCAEPGEVLLAWARISAIAALEPLRARAWFTESEWDGSQLVFARI